MTPISLWMIVSATNMFLNFEANFNAEKFKTYFDIKSQDRQFVKGDEVLLLLPDQKKKLLMSWSGPFKVLEKKSKVNYQIDQNGKPRLYQANMLKKYNRRAASCMAFVADE